MSTRVDDLHTGHVPTLREWCDAHDVSDGYVHCLTEDAMAELRSIADAQELALTVLRKSVNEAAYNWGMCAGELDNTCKFAQDALKMADALWRMDGTRSELKRLHERARELGIEES